MSDTWSKWKPIPSVAGGYIVVRDCTNGDREVVINLASGAHRRFATLARAKEEAKHLNNAAIPRGDHYSNQEGKGL